MQIQIINGPNLNIVGKREQNLYGNLSFDDFFEKLKQEYSQIKLDYFQSNSEGKLIDKLHETGFIYDGIIINAGAYTHTSIAIADAVAGITCPVVEVHITNIFKREKFRHNSFIAPYCMGSISGFGLNSYKLAIESFIQIKNV